MGKDRPSYKSWRKCAQRFGSGDEHTQLLACNLFMPVICSWLGGLKGMSSRPVFMYSLNSVVVMACQKKLIIPL